LELYPNRVVRQGYDDYSFDTRFVQDFFRGDRIANFRVLEIEGDRLVRSADYGVGFFVRVDDDTGVFRCDPVPNVEYLSSREGASRAEKKKKQAKNDFFETGHLRYSSFIRETLTD
jgi:hypothetical protein